VLLNKGPVADNKRKRGSGAKTKINSLTKPAVLERVVSLETSPKRQRIRHSSQRDICQQLNLSKGAVALSKNPT